MTVAFTNRNKKHNIMKKIAFLAPFAALALLALAACSRVEPVNPGTDLPIRVDAGIGVPTRTTTDGNTEAFTSGDQVALFVWTGSNSAVPADLVVNGVVNTLQSDGTWAPASKMYWKDVESAHYFLGVFPARAISNFKMDSFTINPSDYEASDLLVATKLEGIKATEVPVPLSFKHVMSKFQLNLSYSNQWDTAPAGTTAEATDVDMACKVDYLNGSTEQARDKGNAALTKLAKAASGCAESFSTILIPQAGFNTVTLVVDKQTYIYTHPSDIVLSSGKTTVLNLLVGRDRLELGSMTIADWTSQGEPVEGEVFKPAA